MEQRELYLLAACMQLLHLQAQILVLFIISREDDTAVDRLLSMKSGYRRRKFVQLFSAHRRRSRRSRRMHELATRLNTFILDMVREATINRTIWVNYRPTEVWEHAKNSWPDSEWRKHFRINRTTFQVIVNELSPFIQHEHTTMRQSISPEKRLAITLWRLGTPDAYRTVSVIFGVGVSTACKITHEVCRAIQEHLLHRYITMPTGDAIQEVVQGFHDMSGFPQCMGAVDGTHIEIDAPPDNPADYLNRKTYHSIILQAVVDHRLRFTDVYIGWPGSVHDARVLSNSSLYHRGEAGTLFPLQTREFNGVQIPLMIVGDAAYPLLKWLMKGYAFMGRLTPAQTNFNETLNRARIVVERAFGQLKMRWRSIYKLNESKVENMPHLVSACCVLHNICELQHDENDFNDPSEKQTSNEERDAGHDVPPQQHPENHNATANQYRNALTEYLYA